MKASIITCNHPHSKMVSFVRPLPFGSPENIGLSSYRARRMFLNLVMTCSCVSVRAAILFVMGLIVSANLLQIVSVLFEAISHAAVTQVTNSSSLTRSLVLLQSAMIRVRLLFAAFLFEMNPVISGMMCGSASGVGYPWSSVRWSFFCSMSMTCFNLCTTVSVLSVYRA